MHTYTFLACPIGEYTVPQAMDINNARHIVGTCRIGSEYYGVLYDGTEYVALDYPDSSYTWGEDINDAGWVSAMMAPRGYVICYLRSVKSLRFLLLKTVVGSASI